MTLLSNARVVIPGRFIDPGWIRTSGNTIVAVGSGPVAGETETIDLQGRWVVPGFVDLHVHGGGGHDFTRSAADIEAGVAFHRRHGTTTSLVSLMAGGLDDTSERLGWIAELAGRPGSRIAGAHLEGPFLAQSRCGAQNPAHLTLPDRQVLAKLLEAGQGHVRTVTLAPELPGALELVDDLVAAGAVAAVGHTDADYRAAAAAFGRGAALATHLFNAMPEVGHRAPGPVGAALDADVVFEIINDGMHVDPAVVRLVARAGATRLALVTDAISATGAGDGDYFLGGQAVQVRNGAARLTAGDALAGSTLTMDVAFRRAVHELGLTLPQAAAAASSTPAGVLGLGDRIGAIAPGLAADLVVLDDDLRVERVMVAGSFV